MDLPLEGSGADGLGSFNSPVDRWSTPSFPCAYVCFDILLFLVFMPYFYVLLTDVDSFLCERWCHTPLFYLRYHMTIPPSAISLFTAFILLCLDLLCHLILSLYNLELDQNTQPCQQSPCIPNPDTHLPILAVACSGLDGHPLSPSVVPLGLWSFSPQTPLSQTRRGDPAPG